MTILGNPTEPRFFFAFNLGDLIIYKSRESLARAVEVPDVPETQAFDSEGRPYSLEVVAPTDPEFRQSRRILGIPVPYRKEVRAVPGALTDATVAELAARLKDFLTRIRSMPSHTESLPTLVERLVQNWPVSD